MLANEKDISAMKLAAITGRGSKKDFIDLYFRLQKFNLKQLIGFYNQKYSVCVSPIKKWQFNNNYVL